MTGRLPSGFTTRPELRGSFGMVAGTHWLAVASGMSILERGGNAFDAAAAAGFVLEVVEPHQNGPGGEAPMIGYSALEDEAFVVDGQGVAPAAATTQRFADLGLELVPGSGLLAACVPAALGAWFAVLERFGTLPLEEVMAPAIGYARHGFPVLPVLSRVLGEVAASWAEAWPTTSAHWLHHGVPAPSSRLRNEQLASTYERILAESRAGGPGRGQLEAARRAVYEGFVAEAIDAFVTAPVADELGVHAGLITGADLAAWRCGLEAPVRRAYRDVEILKTGPWGQGPVLLQQLGLLEGYDLAELSVSELVHVSTECAKLAMADREAFYGDPRRVEVPLEQLLGPAYCAERRRLVGEEASLELRPGEPGGRSPQLPSILARLGAGAPGALVDPLLVAGGTARLAAGAAAGQEQAGPRQPGSRRHPGEARLFAGDQRERDTCHLDVVDRFGNMVSATPSGGWLQASPTIPSLGFCLGTRAQMFWLEEGLANSIAPGKRPRTTLSPAMALRDGKPVLAFGTPGGDQQDQWTISLLVHHLDLGYDLQAAIDAANWHTNHLPSSFFPRHVALGELVVETSLGGEVLEDLRRRGHRLVESPPLSIGRVSAVGVDRHGFFCAGADPRTGQAYAAGR